jgi:GxxExxY protein
VKLREFTTQRFDLTAEYAEIAEKRMEINQLTEAVIGACIEVHRNLGPGLLESAYHQCLCHELTLRGIPFQKEFPLAVSYKGTHLDCGYKADLVVDGRLLLELKSVDALNQIHEAQLMTYLRLGGWEVGLLINFNVTMLKDGIRRRVLKLKE